MKRIALCACLAAAFTLAGCSTVGARWAPFPANKELTSFADRWAVAPRAGAGQEVSDMQRELVKYRDEIYATALERSKLEWESSGLTTYGGLAAVAGALADRTGLMNVGAGLAAIGLTQSTRYRFHDQTQIYVAALKRMACITGKVNSTSDTTIALATGANDRVAAEAARNFTRTVVASVDFVRAEYTNGLLGLSPTVPTREEFLALLNTYRPVAAAAAGAPDLQQVARDQAGEIVKALVADIQNCSKI